MLRKSSLMAQYARILKTRRKLLVIMFCALIVACESKQQSSTASHIPKTIEQSELLFEMDFDEYTGNYQAYTQQSLLNDFDEANSKVEARASGQIRGFDSSEKTWPARNTVGFGNLKADFPANIASGKQSGFLFDKQLPDMELATIEYKIKFDDNFVWAAGGKLPGLAGAADDAGIPVGCTKNQKNIKNGFSARLMWRRDGNLVLYTYFPDRQNNCGEDYPFFKAVAGEWYTITQTIRLNTPGESDGKIWMYVNDELVYTKNDALFREVGKENVKINAAIFHTYRGGKATDPRFHSPRQEFIYFDDFKIWRGHKPEVPASSETMSVSVL